MDDVVMDDTAMVDSAMVDAMADTTMVDAAIAEEQPPSMIDPLAPTFNQPIPGVRNFFFDNRNFSKLPGQAGISLLLYRGNTV